MSSVGNQILCVAVECGKNRGPEDPDFFLIRQTSLLKTCLYYLQNELFTLESLLSIPLSKSL